jgi:hypothetical protein
MKEKTSSLLFRLKTWSSFALFILFIVSDCANFIRQDTNKYHPCEIPGGTQLRFIFLEVVILNELQNAPWPRSANAHIDFIKLFRRPVRAQLRL